MDVPYRRVRPGGDEGCMRAFDPFQDLQPVIELIALAFGDRLDPAGKATLDRMRRFARGGTAVQWLWAFLGKAGVAPGLVWVEDGQVVGNVSLRRARGRRGYLIGNVVVHPEWRGQGIGRALMRAAMDRVSRRGARWVGLEVRADNDVALRLYEGLGFREVGRTHYMLRPAGLAWDGPSPSAAVVRPGRGRDGDALVALMREMISKEHRPLLEVEEADYQPGWRRRLAQWLRGEREVWAVVEGSEGLRGAVRAVRKRGRFPNELEILVEPGEEGVAPTLVRYGLATLNGSPRKPVGVSLPAWTEALVAALEDEGFEEIRVLVQMKRSLREHIPVAMSGEKKTGPL